jgi:hypothetical protein
VRWRARLYCTTGRFHSEQKLLATFFHSNTFIFKILVTNRWWYDLLLNFKPFKLFKNMYTNSQFLPISWLRFCSFLCFLLVMQKPAFAQGCSQPSNLNSNVLASGVVSLSWSAPGGALTYTVQYRQGTSGPWTNGGTVTTTNQILAGLLPETVYTWRVKANCSTYSSVATFNSGGGVGGNNQCSSPSNLEANVTSQTTATLSWSAIEGALYYTVQYRVNNLGVWTNAGSVTGTSIAIGNLLMNTEYGWRVKASCSPYSSVALFNTGSQGSGGNNSCSQPSNLDALALSNTSVELSWSEIQEAQNYTVQYRVGLVGNWITLGSINGLSVTLMGLLENTEYSWRVKASCSDYSSVAVFTTGGGSSNGGGSGGGSSSCSSPSNTNTLAVTPTTASVEWEAQGGALNYTVQYRLQNGDNYVTVGTFTVANAIITGLTPGTEYVWRVKANCSPYGSDVQFATPFSSQGQSNIGIRSATALENPMTLFPNPVSADVVQLTVPKANSLLRVFDGSGSLVVNQQLRENQFSMSVSNWNNGVYFVQVVHEEGFSKTVKLVVAH